MRYIGLAGLVAFSITAATSVMAEDKAFSTPRGVVELFTSQGCSSCPPADAAFIEIVEKDGIIAVSYHVDYWNYRGWEDTLSSRKYSDRQYGYASTLGHSNVYTPQAVLNGRDDATASDVAAIMGKLDAMRAEGRGLTVPVTASLSPEELKIEIGAGQGKADIVVAYIRERATIAIGRGENAGETIDYVHPVVDMATIGMWSGEAATIRLPAALVTKAGHDGCAIFLQTRDADGNPGAILGAAILDDYGKN